MFFKKGKEKRKTIAQYNRYLVKLVTFSIILYILYYTHSYTKKYKTQHIYIYIFVFNHVNI